MLRLLSTGALLALTTLPALGKRPNAVDMDLDPETGAARGL